MSDTQSILLERIRQRIRPVCRHMDEVEFSALTQRMAEVEYKYITES